MAQGLNNTWQNRLNATDFMNTNTHWINNAMQWQNIEFLDNAAPRNNIQWDAINLNNDLFWEAANNFNMDWGKNQFLDNAEFLNFANQDFNQNVNIKNAWDAENLQRLAAANIQNANRTFEDFEFPIFDKTNTIKTEITRLDSQINTMNTHLAQKKAQLEQRQQELETKEQELEEAKANLLQEEQKLQTIQDDIAAKNKERQDIQNQLEEKQNNLIIKFGQARNETLKKAQQEYDPAKDGNYNAYLSNKMSQVATDPAISAEITELSNQLTGINRQLSMLNSQLMNQQNTVRSATRNVNSLQSQVFALNSTVAMLEAETNAYEDNIKTLEASKTTAQNKLDENNTAERTENKFKNIDFEEIRNARGTALHRTEQFTPDALQNLQTERKTVRTLDTTLLNTITHNAQTARTAERTITPDIARKDTK